MMYLCVYSVCVYVGIDVCMYVYVVWTYIYRRLKIVTYLDVRGL